MLLETLGIVAGLVLLVGGADRFILGAANLARNLGIAPMIIGLAIIGIVTSMPEILVGTVAALDGKTEIAIGNAIGSNIANMGLVLGLTAVIMPLNIRSKTLRREYMVMFISALLACCLMLDQSLSRTDAVILLLALVIFMFWIIRIAMTTPTTDPIGDEIAREFTRPTSIQQAVFHLLVGLVLLLGGAELLVRSAVVVARIMGISDLVIGLTIIAVGTSLPELAASLMSVIKKEADIAIGNVLGSNMFNMLAVIGVPGLISPSGFPRAVVFRDFPVMIGMTLIMGWVVFVTGAGKFSRTEGAVLLLCFISYQYWLFV